MNEKLVEDLLKKAYDAGNEGLAEMRDQEVALLLKEYHASFKKEADKPKQTPSNKVRLGDLFAAQEKKSS
jgi:hypothetical protein